MPLGSPDLKDMKNGELLGRVLERNNGAPLPAAPRGGIKKNWFIEPGSVSLPRQVGEFKNLSLNALLGGGYSLFH